VTDRQVLVRAAQSRDLDTVVGIERTSFADPWSRESFESSIEPQRMRFLVAVEVDASVAAADTPSGEPRILGYVVALLLFDEAEIANLAVAPSARRRGIGCLLLDRMSGDLAGDGVVRESNAGARALYASRSFEEVGRRRRYYRHPTEDALLLKRNLQPT